MIYISSSGIQGKKIGDVINTMAKAGIRNIELSGGTEYYQDMEKDLLRLQDHYSLNYLVHNYFPPAKNDFLLNLSSLDEQNYTRSIEHCKKAIDLCKKLGSKKYAFHAGYLLDIPISEIGKSITKKTLFAKKMAINRFAKAYGELENYSGGQVKLYVENNVLSENNLKRFGGENPFLFTDVEGYEQLRKVIDFKPLVDLAHLKVSANSAKKDYKTEISYLTGKTDYIHVSENDGKSDMNLPLSKDSQLLEIATSLSKNNYLITLEIYSRIDEIINSLTLLRN